MATPPYLLPQRAAPLVNTGSAMDRHMSTGLSGQPTRPVGRSMKDAGRQIEIAGRRLRSAGDYEGAARLSMAQDWHNQRLGSMLPQIPQATPERPMGSMPGPGGKWVDGRSAGSQVWQPNAPVIDVPSEPIPMPSFGTGSSAPQQPLAPLPLPPLEGNNPLTGLPLSDRPPMLPFGTVSQGMQGFPGMAPPPPGLYGEAAPRFQEYEAGDMNLIVDSTTGKQVQSYKRPQPLGYQPVPGMNLLLPQGDGAERLPVLQQQGMIEAPRPEAAFMGPMPGRPKLTPYTPPPQPTDAPKIPDGIQHEKDANGKITGGVYPTYNEQGRLVMRRIDLDGDGVVSPAEQAAAMQAAGQTPGGVKFSRVQ